MQLHSYYSSHLWFARCSLNYFFGGGHSPAAESATARNRRIVGLLAAVLPSIAGIIMPAPSALAEPITYTEQVVASGSLDGTAFTDASVLLKMNNNTTNVVFYGTGYAANLGTATVSVGGVGTDTFKDQISAVDVFDGTPPYVGFEDLTIGQIILIQCGDSTCNLGDTTFGGYYLTTAIGPITGKTGQGVGVPIPTAGGGDLILSSTSGLATFTATVVPESSTWAMLLLGFAGLGYAGCRMPRRAQSAPFV